MYVTNPYAFIFQWNAKAEFLKNLNAFLHYTTLVHIEKRKRKKKLVRNILRFLKPYNISIFLYHYVTYHPLLQSSSIFHTFKNDLVIV